MRDKHIVSPTPPTVRIASNKRRATSEVNSSRHRREVVAALVVAMQLLILSRSQLDADRHCLGSRTVELACNAVLRGPQNGEAHVLTLQLCHELEVHCGLRNSKLLGLKEKVAIFLRLCRTGDSHRKIREVFQHAPGTILTYVHAYLLDNNTEHGIGFFSRHSIYDRIEGVL